MLVSLFVRLPGKMVRQQALKIVLFSSSLYIFYAILRKNSAYRAVRYNSCSVTQKLICTVCRYVRSWPSTLSVQPVCPPYWLPVSSGAAHSRCDHALENHGAGHFKICPTQSHKKIKKLQQIKNHHNHEPIAGPLSHFAVCLLTCFLAFSLPFSHRL
jgi:hypothetical protein